ncbi:type 2C protein phosphatase PTC5 [Saccharomyces eubayanus]|uniref:type 2C protein phosphatase PTC5 n=1 Tax=Saccharomyces eubayanus TaxID=1080349 RepID=UPI0006C27B7A|nr:PTC5-like protein [Saccharomyces eubayanus]KOG96593.1 PTC5-like protein [Saccharomyces eubayanus]
MSPLTRTVAIRKTIKVLSKCQSGKEYTQKFLQRAYSTSHANSSYCSRTKIFVSSHYKALNIALLSGSLLLTYSYYSPKKILSLDTINGIKDYSTSTRGNTGMRTPNSKESQGPKDQQPQNDQSVPILNDAKIEAKLHDREESHFVNRGTGIFRYDVAQLPSNHPIEDDHVEQIITIPITGEDGKSSEKDLYFFGIFDGHGGPFTSEKLSKDLIRYVAYQLGQVYDQNKSIFHSDPNGLIDSAISKGFLKLDDDIVMESFRKLFQDPSNSNIANTLPAISGSCALLSLYNSTNSILKVAVTGDSRALICGLDSDGKWTVRSLSTDQTGDSLEEVQRIRNEHPGEPNVIRNGRVLGSLQPSRAFGDYRYKVKEVDGKPLSDLPEVAKLYFRKEPRDFKTPPYVTAEPAITSAKIGKDSKFMVMGSDGLFELLTNEEIASLVIRWMDKNMSLPTPFKAEPGKLPKVVDVSDDKEAQRPAFRYKDDKSSSNTEYLLEDKNVATHLIRNALSAGGRKEYVSALVSIPSPMSRRYRDDLTVTVAFFGDSGTPSNVSNATSIVMNPDATTKPKPRL